MTCNCNAHTPPAGSGVSLSLHNITKTFHRNGDTEIRALEGVTIRVHHHEIVVLLGPTGCGKSTLLNMVNGLCRPDAGSIQYGAGITPGRTIPCVFQHYTLFPWRTVLKNVAFAPHMRGSGKKERETIARELLGQVGLKGFENASPNELSGGMRQRAAIAQALAVSPELLLMDEPFGALDEKTRRMLQELIIELWQRNTMSCLFVTHNIDEAISMADRIYILTGRPGRVAEEIPVSLPRPRNRFSDAFIALFETIRKHLYRE